MDERSREKLKREFHKQMVAVHRNALDRCNYRATRFIGMVSKHGGLDAARRLLAGKDLSHGLRELALCGCLGISMEALVLRQPWCLLFTDSELELARKRLRDLNFEPPT